jgi:hypothetical protein
MVSTHGTTIFASTEKISPLLLCGGKNQVSAVAKCQFLGKQQTSDA